MPGTQIAVASKALPALGAPEALPTSSSSTLSRLTRFALANLRRKPERFVLATLGIALAILSVTVVRTISASLAITGADTVTRVLDGSSLWVVPGAGVRYDAQADALVAEGPAPSISLPEGWTGHRTVAGAWKSRQGDVALYGTDDTASGTAIAGSDVAKRLGLTSGTTLRIAGNTLTVTVTGGGPILQVPTAVAQAAVGTVGWWTVTQPPADTGRNDLGVIFGEAVGLPTTTDPTVQPSGNGLIYDTVARGGAFDFQQKYSAVFSGKVTSSTLGLISLIGLVLGFVIAVSSFLASVQERRREFGIMSSIGLADEVLYFFLVESAVVFVIAYLIGIIGAAAAVAVVIPDIATPVAWAQAAGIVAGFLPAMAIVGALVPVHRLLQQRPVDLLGDS